MKCTYENLGFALSKTLYGPNPNVIAEQNLERQDRLLSTVNKVASLLMSADQSEFESAIHESLALLGWTVGVDRVYIWKNFTKNDKLYGTQIYEWSGGAEPQQGNEYTTDINYDVSAPALKGTLLDGKCINSIVKDMNPEEREILETQGVVSVLILPVFIRNEFWGFIGFDDCQKEKVFSETEENILRSAGLLIASAMMRNEITVLLRGTAAQMEAVISNYTGVIWSVDRDGTIKLFKGLYLNKIGVGPEFIEGKKLEAAELKGRHLDIISNVERTFTEGSQDWISDIDGVMFRCHTTPIYDDNGQVCGVVGSTDDITDSIKMQKDLEKAVEAAQSASNAKSSFLSNMSHEMRTPMNAIIGMTAIGRSAGDITHKDYAFDKIEGASTHLLGVINDILDMSKIEANKFELSHTEFSFEKMIQKVINVISFRVDQKQQQFNISIDREIPHRLIGDDLRLTQVLTNLLTNAVKFTPEGGAIRLSASLLSNEESQCAIKIDINDTGIGISKEQKSRLFASFTQAECNTSRKFGGTGLGLSISKHIIEMMGGTIWVESELDVGSTFSFIVKMQCAQHTEPALISPCISRQNIRVLVVDDDADTLSYFIKIAEQLDIECDTASNGKKAIELVSGLGGYDVYFIDWKMPGMDGIELSKEIHRGGFGRAVIIMISAAQWNEIEGDAKAAGVNGFLPKPLLPGTVAECINEAIGEEAAVEKGHDYNGEFNGRCALLAEDIEINREIVLALFKPTGLEIDCAENGTETLRMFKESPEKYDVIIMDVQMPEMDGFEATRRIRALDCAKAKEIPIIAMTANVFKEDIEKCMETGMNDHVGKPLDFNEIMAKLCRLLF